MKKVAEVLKTGNNGINHTPSAGLSQTLYSILETILQMPWLNTNTGGIFIATPENQTLTLAAQINFSTQVKKNCAKLNYGQCLCGQAAQTKTTIHVSRLHERHNIQLQSDYNHGRYAVPVKFENQVLGVLVLYIDAGQSFSSNEVQVLENFANIIAQLIHTERLYQEKQLSDLILMHSTHGVMLTDQNLKIQWVNPAFEKISGYKINEVVGQTPKILRSNKQDSDFYLKMWTSIKTQGFWEGEIWNRRKNGEIYPEWLNIVALKDTQGEVLRYAGLFVDLTPIKSANDKIYQLANFDQLTALPNLYLFQKKLNQLLSLQQSTNEIIVLFNLGLDYFKEINEGLGRHVGDAVLKIVAERIQAHSPRRAVIGRIESDEFIIAFPITNTSHEQLVLQIAQYINEIRKSLLMPIQFDKHDLRLSSSIGISWCSECGSNCSCSNLLKHAAVALNSAKNSRRGSYQFYDENMQHESNHLIKLGLGLNKAIEREELFLTYQPQIDQQGHIVGAEVLLRWQSKEFGLVSPDVFIPIAESHGDIIDIGQWVFSNAIKQLKAWEMSGLFHSTPFKRLAINISPHQLLSNNAIDALIELCHTSGVSPKSIELEITEESMMVFSDNIIERLKNLHDHGFSIAIDDFGTGYSSLARLTHFPIKALKIDRSFVSKMNSENTHSAIVKYIINMAKTLGMQVIAEGVEDKAQLAVLISHGCDVFQGHYFSKSITDDEFQTGLITGSFTTLKQH